MENMINDDDVIIIDSETGEVILDTTWPTLWVDSIDESMMICDDLAAWDRAEITVDEFKDMWGDFHPDGEWLVGIRPPAA